jgi:hypothetical protein
MLLDFDFTQAQGNHSLDTLFRVITLQTDSTDFWFQIELCKIRSFASGLQLLMSPIGPVYSVSFTGEFSPNPYLKNMISTYRKEFHEKKGPNSPDFEKKILSIARFLLLVPVGGQKIQLFLFFLISILVHVAKFD